MKSKFAALSLVLLLLFQVASFAEPSKEQLAAWLKRFPEADANKDGQLTVEEANAFRQKLRSRRPSNSRGGAPREFKVDKGWDLDRFPEHAVSYLSPKEIAEVYAKQIRGNQKPIVSYPEPKDGSLRIVATGHSFMAPGFRTFPRIARAAGFEQPDLVTHVGGGITGSARYKWEQENGIFQFDGKPVPKLLASISNAEWDVMLWGPYFHDRAAYYSCWIEFCLKYNPDMKFYLSDAWPQLDQLDPIPTKEKELTPEVFDKMNQEKREIYGEILGALNEKYPGKVFVLPTCEAMTLAAKYYLRGELPGVEGLHQYVGKKEKSLWRDRLGHLGTGFSQLEGYVFYAAVYGRSPEAIESEINFGGNSNYPSQSLDRVFRKIAWEAALNDPRSGVTDKNRNGVADDRE